MIPLFDWIGYNGPYILVLICCILLVGRYNAFFIGYIIFSLMNKQLNDILKLFFKQSRPKGQIYTGIDHDKFKGSQFYGMPSGHAQSISFSIIFVYLITRSQYFLLFMGLIWGLTLYQRYKYKRHSIEQLALGSLVGGGFAVISYNITEQVIKKYYNNYYLV